MSPVIIDKDVITIAPAAGMTVLQPATDIVKVNTSTKNTVDNLAVALTSDIEAQTLSVNYAAGSFVTPGAGTITYKWPNKAANLFKDGEAVLINSGVGNWSMEVTTPAIQPGSPPVPDPSSSYTGTFTITTLQTKLLA